MDKMYEYYKALDENVKEFLKDTFDLGINSCYSMQSWPVPKDAYNEVVDQLNKRKTEIEDFFNDRAVIVNWSNNGYEGIKLLDYDEIKKQSRWNGKWITFYDLVKCDSCIDLESSPMEHVDDAIKLATLAPEELFGFIYSDNSEIDCEYNG